MASTSASLPLGTALTDEQARQLATLSNRPVVATDADLPGRVAAERAFWLLAQHGTDPLAAGLQDGDDPASVLHAHGPQALLELLVNARPLGQLMVDERLANLPGPIALEAAVRVIAARPPSTWATAAADAAGRAGVDLETATARLGTGVTAWNRDPTRAAADHPAGIAEVRARLDAQQGDPTHRWAPLADAIDPRLTTESDWPALAEMLQNAHDAGHDVPDLTRQLIAHSPLGQVPAQYLRYRLVTELPEPTLLPTADRHRTESADARPAPFRHTRAPAVAPRCSQSGHRR